MAKFLKRAEKERDWLPENPDIWSDPLRHVTDRLLSAAGTLPDASPEDRDDGEDDGSDQGGDRGVERELLQAVLDPLGRLVDAALEGALVARRGAPGSMRFARGAVHFSLDRGQHVFVVGTLNVYAPATSVVSVANAVSPASGTSSPPST